MKNSLSIIQNNINTYGCVDDVTLIAVSKRQQDDRIKGVLALGVRVFGENQVQEAMTRWQERRENYHDLSLHLLGPLQSNKVKDAVALFDVIHSVDRLKIAQKIALEAEKQGRVISCFIQVNTGNEAQKSGVDITDLDGFYTACIDLGLNIIGLMCIPPIDEEPAFHFALLQKKAQQLGGLALSMGMSGDYETALRLGATHIRVGSALFGERAL